jgi:hypothetical protein
MAEDLITEDDDEELIPVDTPPEENLKPENIEDDDEDEEDERLADDAEDDAEGDTAVNTNRNKRLKRRQVQKLAKENAQRELRSLREQNEMLARRLSAVEGNALNNNEAILDQRINEAQSEIRQTELILARAIEAGNGEDAARALQLRDDARDRASQLEKAKTQVTEAKQPQQPTVDPVAQRFARDWMEANPWYDPRGGDEASAITKAIDQRLMAEGFDPKSIDYWNELTSRVSTRFKSNDTDTVAPEKTPRKKAPPMGNTREHAPQSTKKEVYVTPERKQAMIEAGYWDDPVKRTQMLKAYQAHDRNSAR